MKMFIWAMVIASATGVRAETLARGGETNAPVVSEAEDLFNREFRSPITFANGEFKELAAQGICKVKVKRQTDNSVYIHFMTRSSEKVTDDNFEQNGLWRGEGVVASDYPLQVKSLRVLSQDFMPNDRKFVASFDGSFLRFVDTDTSVTPHIISVYEFSVDSHLSNFKTMSYQEYEGNNLKDAKPTRNKVICNNLMS